MTRSLVVRADGGPGRGVGHLARCLALVQAWVDRGGQATLLSASPPSDWAARFEAEGVEVRAPAGAGWDATWVVVDGYHLAAEAADARARSHRLLLIDDHGTTGTVDADLILDQNLGAAPEPYADRGVGTDLLLGPRYALLRREFRQGNEGVRPVPERARRLLVAMGGAPSNQVRDLLDVTLADPRLAELEVVRLEGVDDVTTTMAAADVALSASGTTCWELCCTALPAVLIPVAANQEPLAGSLETAGAAISAGPLHALSPDRLAALVAELARDPARRQRMAERGPQIVDGRGALRVVTRMLSALLDLRPVTAADARLLWEWTNDPAVRAASFSSEPIPWDTHVQWLSRRLADPDARIYVASTLDGTPVGQVRFEGDGERAEISVSVAPGARGQGWGAALVDAGVRRVFSTSAVATVVARIKPENVQSRKSFEDAGFSPVEEPTGGRTPQLNYVRTKDGELASCLTSL